MRSLTIRLLPILLSACGAELVATADDATSANSVQTGGDYIVDRDGDGVANPDDCNDDDSAIGALLYHSDFAEDGSLAHTDTLQEPWTLDGSATNQGAGQQALIGTSFEATDTVTFATVRSDGMLRRCEGCKYAVFAAISDSRVHGGNGDHALWFPRLLNNQTEKMVFESAGTFSVDHDAGRATLTGVAVGSTAGILGERFEVRMDFSFRGVGDEGVGSAGPKKELRRRFQKRFITDQWQYYNLDRGYVRGLDRDLEIKLQERPGIGIQPMQMGPRAAGKNLNFGTSVWFGWQSSRGGEPCRSGHGDLNADLVEVDRYRVGVLARANFAGAPDEGFTGYRCAVARNSFLDYHNAGNFVQLATFEDGPEDDYRGESDPSAANGDPTFTQLQRRDHDLPIDFLAGEQAELVLWAVGNALRCEVHAGGETAVAEATDNHFGQGSTGLSVLNNQSEFTSLRVCEALHLPGQ